MIIHMGYLIAGVLLALFPGHLLRNDKCHEFDCERLRRHFADTGRRRRRWWKLPAVWIEPVRSFLAVTMLTSGLQSEPSVTGPVRYLALGLPLSILLLGISVQIISAKNTRHLIAPVGYLGGALFAWLPACVSIPCVILGASSALAFRHWEVGFIIGSASCLTIGYFFLGACPRLLAISLIYAWPVILTALLRRKLVLPVRS